MYVDTNILVYLLRPDTAHGQAASAAFRRLGETHRFRINDVVFAELAPGFRSADDVATWLETLNVDHLPSPKEALFRAALAFRKYRSAGGIKTSPLPDFFIGADAEFASVPLLTNDRGRYKTYFPDLELIAP